MNDSISPMKNTLVDKIIWTEEKKVMPSPILEVKFVYMKVDNVT